ncbi:hypothetical protein FQZ97_646140 [compost metagenome]
MAQHLFEAAFGNPHAGQQPARLRREQRRRMLPAVKERQGIVAVVQAVPFLAGVFVQAEEGTVGHADRHALVTQDQDAFGLVAQHRVARQLQGAAARGAAIAEVEDRYAGQANLGEYLLAAARLAIHTGGEYLIDQVVVDAGIIQRRPNRPTCQRSGTIASAERNERRHPHPRDQHAIRHEPTSRLPAFSGASLADPIHEAPPVSGIGASTCESDYGQFPPSPPPTAGGMGGSRGA